MVDKQEKIWLQDLERVTESEYLPQERFFSRFLSKKLPKIPENDDERKFFPAHRFGVLDFVLFKWVMPIIKVGYKRTIQPNDLFKINNKETVQELSVKFESHWKEIVAKKNGKLNKLDLIWACFLTFKWEYCLSILYVIICNSSLALLPLVSKKLIQFVEEKHVNSALKVNDGIGYAIGCALLLFIFGLMNSHSNYNSYVVGGLVRSVLQRSILIKNFNLSNTSKKKFSQAVISSMSTTDLNRIEIGIAIHPMLYAFPPALAIVIGQLVHNIGPISLIGCAFFAVSTVVGVFGFSYAYVYRIRANVETDKRIGLVREIANYLKIIKFYCWENAYFQKIFTSRKKEINEIKKLQFCVALYVGIGIVTPMLAPLLVFVSYYGINKNLSSAANLFSSLSLFSSLTGFMFMLPEIFSNGMTAFVAFKRIQEFLLLEEIDAESLKNINCKDENNSIEIDNCSFQWQENNETEALKQKSSFKGLRDISFNIKKGEFVVVTGPIGSGKSSLLYALAKLLEMKSGEMRMNGDLLLNAKPWIQNTTIKNNIIFGAEFDKEKYRAVVNACCLKEDIDLLIAKDNTEIGERGVNLSGGQRQRLALARTCYKDADIYLLDDVLSAVDANVGKHIMEHCLLKYLGEKTRILATHQLNLIASADKVIFLDYASQLTMGTFEELFENNSDFKSLVETSLKSDISYKNFDDSEDDSNSLNHKSTDFDDEKPEKLDAEESSIDSDKYEKEEIYKGRIIEKEQRAINAIEKKVYKSYLQYGSKLWELILPIFSLNVTLNQFCFIFTGVWLSFWSEYKFKGKSDGFYIGIYCLMVFGSFFLTTIESFSIFLFNLSSSKNIHNAAVKNILHVPMSYMDKTPIGTIINRFTKDIDVLDNDLPMAMDMVTYGLSNVIAIMILTIIYLPWFAIAVPFLVLLFYIVRDIYQTTGREVKRIESVQRSFVVNNFQEALSGLDTISMFKMQDMFIYKNDFTTNKQNEATMVFQGLQRWSSVWIMFLAVISTFIVCIMCVTRVFSVGAASTGVLINYLLEMSASLRMLLLQTTEFENFMNSTERVCHYASELEQEAEYVYNDPGQEWPLQATIKFNDVCMRYKENLPLVLKNLSFEIKNGEKIGICGKTGCGKSSTVNTLFRINEIESGSILIDGVDISKIGLYNLRSKIGIIPQESVLFKTTVRGNLDPFNEYSDDDLWLALVNSGAIDADELETVKMQKFPEESETGHKFHLFREVEEDGNNFSLGEKQLLGLSRAVVRKSKILVLDEATSSVDYQTDAKIQNKIKENFGKGTTILTIAHRLKTIIDYDRIMVLDAGEVIEFDKPYTLFKQEGSVFRQLCEKAKIVDTDFI